MSTAARTPDQPLRIALVNDYDIVVRGLADVLATSDLDAVLVSADELPSADVVLFDTFGHAGGWDAVPGILESGTPVVVFSWESPPADYLDLVETGLAGFLSKRSDAVALADALRAVARGDILHAASEPDAQVVGAWPGQGQGLTARESEILALILQGLGNDEIARVMFLSVNTIKTHVRTAYRKMDVVSRTQAVLWGIDHGMGARTTLGRAASDGPGPPSAPRPAR